MRIIRFVIYFGLLLGSGRASLEPEASALPRHLQEGFLTWESNRTGAWRIFTRSLAGGPPRQLSPDVEGRDHFAAHISPDGTKVVYLSFPKGMNGYRKHGPDVKIPMYLLDLTTGRPPRIIMENARPYGEHRSAVWLSNEELVTIDHHYITHRLNLTRSTLERLVKDQPPGRSWDHGYLLDPTLQTAFSGLPGFFRYDPDTQRVTPRDMMPGCQPNVTPDGVWGYWVEGMGGPINRYHIASGQTGLILEKHDPRMPEDRGYIYFPHISPCRQLLVFASSPDDHDHHKSDYDLFVAPLNPATLELSANPVRFTFNSATDRFPEVFVEPLALGMQTGEAPFRPRITASTDSDISWTVNGAPHKDPPFIFTRPGTYLIEAQQEAKREQGLVVVSPAAPPRIVSAVLTREGEAALTFDEPVSLEDLEVEFSGGHTLKKVYHNPGNSFVRILPDPTPADTLTLTLRGIRDTAEYPNLMPPVTLTLSAAVWPSDPRGLVLLWESGDGQREIFPPLPQSPQRLNLTPRNRARFTAHQAMLLDGGAYLAEEAGEPLLEALRLTDELTLEAVILPRQEHQTGPARIITFSSGTTSRNFTLGQEGNQLVIRLRTDNTDANAHRQQIELGALDTASPTHVTLTYRPGKLTAYFDGEQVHHSTVHQGGFDSWETQSLLFGEEKDGNRGWSGTLEGVAVYDRALSADEAAANADRAMERPAARAPVPTFEVVARLISATPIPSLEEIDPYHSILVVHEYETVQNLNSPEVPERFRVHHWGLLDAQVQTLPVTTPGQTARLVLEPLEAHGHLEALFPADTLDPDFELPVFLDVAP
jgi:hypothetical protein